MMFLLEELKISLLMMVSTSDTSLQLQVAGGSRDQPVNVRSRHGHGHVATSRSNLTVCSLALIDMFIIGFSSVPPIMTCNYCCIRERMKDYICKVLLRYYD